MKAISTVLAIVGYDEIFGRHYLHRLHQGLCPMRIKYMSPAQGDLMGRGPSTVTARQELSRDSRLF